MPEWHADFLEVRICQVGEYRDINLVLGKELSVLTKDRASEASPQFAALRPLPRSFRGVTAPLD